MRKETPTEISIHLTKYLEILAQKSLPLEHYRLYHLDFGELKRLEEQYFQSYRSFMTYVVSLDGYQLDGHLGRINKIHGKYQSVLASFYKAIKRREKGTNLNVNRAFTKTFWRERMR